MAVAVHMGRVVLVIVVWMAMTIVGNVTGSAATADDAGATFSLNVAACAGANAASSGNLLSTYGCTGFPDAAGFRIEDAAGNNIRSNVVGSGGLMVFGDLEAGAYRVIGDAPAGTTSSFILDCQSTMRSLSSVVFYPTAIVDSAINFPVEILAGEQLRCDWFGIPGK